MLLKYASELQSETIMNFYKQIGVNVKRYRVAKGYSQLDLSIALGHKSVGLISQAELCSNDKHFNLEHLYKVAYILDCELSDLIENISSPIN